MKYAYKEVISDSEAVRFARNLQRKQPGRFAMMDDALEFVMRIRTVVSNTEYRRMHHAHLRVLARQYQRDLPPPPRAPTPRAVAQDLGVSA